MSDSIPQLPTIYDASLRAPIRLHSALLLIWVRPHVVLTSLTAMTGWSWSVPLGLALYCFYIRFFTAAFLGSPSQDWALAGGVVAILLGWPVRAALLYSLSKWLRGRPDFFMLLLLSAWATLPLTLRNTAQVIAMVGTGKLVTYPGLSGLLAEADSSVQLVKIGRFLLGWFDLFTVWHLTLLVLAVSVGVQVSRGRALLVVVIYSLLVLIVGSMVAVL